MNNQKNKFINGEANCWFTRNKSAMKLDDENTDISPYEDFIIKNLSQFHNNKIKILEIGCSNGKKLAKLRQIFPYSDLYGIDPSKNAIKDGKNFFKNNKQIFLETGTSDELNFSNCYFDIVIFGFCLYLVDRDLLFKSISEADRVLKNKGFLIITDFDYNGFKKNSYHHLNGIFSYKQDYSKIFEHSGLYHTVSKISYSHISSFFNELKEERISSTLLFKEISD
ncbi:MAG: class I SAM-dependent methyltransferase [Alphaproteobacteria bacterium]